MRAIYSGLIVVVLAGCARYSSSEVRPSAWAAPLEIDGVQNLHRVSPDLYRSEQPTAAGMAGLEELGIRTVVNLRACHSDKNEIAGTGLARVNIPFHTWDPDEDELIRFLRLATAPEKSPVLVHCWHGSDRTGAMCAAYRVVVQGWSKDEAIREMKRGGYGHHKIWENLQRWIRDLDVEKIRAALP